MAANKVVFGEEVIMDLTGDSVSPENLLAGETAHDRAGNPITGAVITHGVVDNLESTSTEDALSANQGRELKEMMSDVPHREDAENTEIEVPNIDADMLDGHPSDYYAKQSDLSALNTSVTQVNNKIGNTDISAIGDGTVTGGLDVLNSNLGLINKKTFLWEVSSNQGSKQIDFSPFSYVLIMISISVYTTQCMIVPTYLKSLSALGIQTQVGIYSQNEYVYANMTYDGTTLSFSSNKTVLFDVIGIQ